MSNKVAIPQKPKSSKRSTPLKSAASLTSSSLYSGVASAQRAILQPGSASPVRSNQPKHSDERTSTLVTENLRSHAEYHSWEPKYNPLYIRENTKKPMTKDPYTQKTHLINHANESITTNAECYLTLIPANTVRTKQPIIHEETKSVLPNSVRQGRGNDVVPSERLSPRISTKKSSISQLQVESKTSLPMIGTNKSNTVASNLVTTDRLLRQTKMRNDASLLRRPSRNSMMDTIHETITPLAVYG